MRLELTYAIDIQIYDINRSAYKQLPVYGKGGEHDTRYLLSITLLQSSPHFYIALHQTQPQTNQTKNLAAIYLLKLYHGLRKQLYSARSKKCMAKNMSSRRLYSQLCCSVHTVRDFIIDGLNGSATRWQIVWSSVQRLFYALFHLYPRQTSQLQSIYITTQS